MLEIILFVVSFALADAGDPSDKPCIISWDTAEAAGGGLLVGYAVGSHPFTLAARLVAAGGGALTIKDSLSRDTAKRGCKVVAAVGGAAVGFGNAKTNPDPVSPVTTPPPAPPPPPPSGY